MPATHATARRRDFSPRGVLVIASLGASVAFVDATIVNIAFPDIAKSFPGTPISSLSWILSAYNIVFAAFLVAAGRLADLVGRRRMFVAGLSVFTLASAACAIAPSVTALIVFRLVQALGAAMLVPASLALVLHAFPEDRRSHGTALLAAVAAGAAGLGPSLGGVLISVSNWRLVFLVNIPIGLAAIFLGRAKLIESRAPGRRRMPDILGAFVFAGAIASLVLAIVKGQEWGWGNVRIISAIVVSVALGLWFIQRCRTQRSPMVDLGLLRVRTFSAANAMTVVAAAGYYGYTLANVLFLTGVWKYSVLDAGLALTPGPFVAAAVAGPSSRLALRIGHRPVLVAGAVIWGLAILWFVARVGLQPNFVHDWLPGILLLGVGAGILLPNISGAAVASAPGEGYATSTGLNSVSRQVGAALGVAVIVAIVTGVTPLDALATFDTAWKFAAGCMFVAAAGCLLVGRVQSEASPDLASAARAAFSPTLLEQPAAAAPPRARRGVTIAGPAAPVRHETPVDFLGSAPLFADLDLALRARIAERLRLVRVDAGDYLFREGDAGDAMYLVRTGRLEVLDERSGRLIRELGRGDVLGELALISDTPRSASLRAARSSELYAIDSEHFHALLGEAPELSLALNRVLAERLRSSRAAVEARRPRPATAAVLFVDGEPADASLARELADAIAAHARCELLDASLAETHGAEGHAPLLDRTEASSDLVLLDAGALSAPTAWTDFCLRQADRILAVTRGGEPDPALAGRADLRGCDLVIRCAGRDYSPAWGESLEPDESHVVREERFDEDVARLARRLTGNSLGIVFSGGGARAFSHIGVLEELEAAGVVIDRVARRQHGGLHRRAVRLGEERRGDRRDLLRRVGPAPAASRLHDPAPRPDPRPARGGDAAPRARHRVGGGAAAGVHLRLDRAAQRAPRRDPPRSPARGSRLQHERADPRAAACSRPSDVH